MKICLWLGLVLIWILTEYFDGDIKICGHLQKDPNSNAIYTKRAGSGVMVSIKIEFL